MFLERTLGHGGGKGQGFALSALNRSLGWFFADYRFALLSGASLSPNKIQVPHGHGYQLQDSSGSFIPTWNGDHTKMYASISSNCFFTLPIDIANSESEFFWICRARGDIHPISRGRDGSGSGWSILSYCGNGGGEMAVITTTGVGAGFQQATHSSSSGLFNAWTTYMGAYKSGSYVKFGVDGHWKVTTNFVSTGLRASGQGLSINRFNSASATANFDLRFLGLSNFMPSDGACLEMHYELLEYERTPEYLRGGVLLGSAGGGPLSYPAQPVLLF